MKPPQKSARWFTGTARSTDEHAANGSNDGFDLELVAPALVETGCACVLVLAAISLLLGCHARRVDSEGDFAS